MKTAVIIGTGQAGLTASRLIDRNNMRLIAFGDNDEKKHKEGEPPVVSVEAAIEREPDLVIVGVLGKDRTEQIIEQVKGIGYTGRVFAANDFRRMIDIRAAVIKLIASEISQVEGSIAEFGVFRGDLAWQLNEMFPERRLYLFDTFEGFDERDIKKEIAAENGKMDDFSDTTVEYVLSRMPNIQNVIIRKGYFPDTAKGLEEEKFSLVSLDPDLYLPCLEGLEFFYPRISNGGMIVVHDYNSFQYSGIKRAVMDFRKEEPGLRLVPLADMHGTAVIIK